MTGILCIGGISASTAQMSIIDSMEFQGEAVALSLEEALAQVVEQSPTVAQHNISIEQAKVEYQKNMRALDRVKDRFGHYNENSLVYLENIHLPQRSNDFAKENPKWQLEETIASLVVEIEKSYFELLHAKEMQAINEENLRIANDLYEQTQQKYELGLVARQQVLNSELNYIRAQTDLESTSTMLTNARMMFNVRMGYEVMDNIAVSDTLTLKEFRPVGIADAVQSAFDNRIEVKRAAFGVELEEISLEIVSRRYTPNTDMYKQQNLKVRQAEQSFESLRKNIEMEVRINYNQMLQKQREIETGRKSVALAQMALDLSQISYEAGIAQMVDVQQAQLQLQQAQLGLSSAILDYNMAVLNFDKSIGRLNEQQEIEE